MEPCIKPEQLPEQLFAQLRVHSKEQVPLQPVQEAVHSKTHDPLQPEHDVVHPKRQELVQLAPHEELQLNVQPEQF